MKGVKDKEITTLIKQRDDLYVLIDTLQTNLRSAVSRIPADRVDEITKTPSYKWVINWRPSSMDQS